MRSCLTPIAILAAILAFALWNGSHMADSTDRWRDHLQQVDALAQAEAWTEALDALAESYEDWSERQTYLHIVAKHDSVDDAAVHGLCRHPGADRVPGGALRPAGPAPAPDGDGAAGHQKRPVAPHRLSASSLFSSAMKVSMSLNWRYTEAKRT